MCDLKVIYKTDALLAPSEYVKDNEEIEQFFNERSYRLVGLHANYDKMIELRFKHMLSEREVLVDGDDDIRETVK